MSRVRSLSWPWGAIALGLGFLLLVSDLQVSAAPILSQQIEPAEAGVGDEVGVTLTIKNGQASSLALPHVDGLQIAGSSTSTQLMFTNGTLTTASSQTFTIVPVRPGDFTIPSFDIHTDDGQLLHTAAMKLHVVAGGNGMPAGNPSPPGGNGPVVLPPTDASAPAPPSESNNAAAGDPDSAIKPPLDADGRPAKVFMLVTPKTTDAYVGETIPMRIEFFIRMDALAQQDSLPTIDGSDFLMNDLSVRPEEDELMLDNEPYHRETWITAIATARSGDFPLLMERDTYWAKENQNVFSDPLGNFFGTRPQLMHANVPSNRLVIHARALPDEGRPPDFTGAIGHFKIVGNASPFTADVGDPVYIDFSVSGEGNFNSVRSPTLVEDPLWKSYVPTSKITYNDESHTQGEKDFHQAIIPKRNGNLPLPAADFSYFDPTAKKYVTIPISLPIISVTGTPLPTPTAGPPELGGSSVAAMSSTAQTDFLPNRLEFGWLRTNLVPAYRQPWFWLVQGALFAAVTFVALALVLASRRRRDDSALEKIQRQRSLRELEQAMSSAVQRGDAVSFFRAARQAVQLQWGAHWQVAPESVTLPLIAEHDPNLAEALAPLFNQADEIMYSREAQPSYDLAEWERRVREDYLPLQTA